MRSSTAVTLVSVLSSVRCVTAPLTVLMEVTSTRLSVPRPVKVTEAVQRFVCQPRQVLCVGVSPATRQSPQETEI